MSGEQERTVGTRGEEWAATPDAGIEEHSDEEGCDTATARNEEEVVKEVVSNKDERPA